MQSSGAKPAGNADRRAPGNAAAASRQDVIIFREAIRDEMRQADLRALRVVFAAVFERRAFFAGAAFFAGVRLLVARLLRRRSMKSTTFVVVSSGASSTGGVTTPLLFMRLAMTLCRRSRNSSL